jgi:hypothetical protein
MTESESEQSRSVAEQEQLDYLTAQLELTLSYVEHAFTEHKPKSGRQEGRYDEERLRQRLAAVAARSHSHTGKHGPPSTGQVHKDAAYYDEVRRAVGGGTRSLLLGTSTKSLERSLAKLKAVEQGESPSSSPRSESNPLAESQSAKTPNDLIGIERFWIVGMVLVFLGILSSVLVAELLLDNWLHTLLQLLPLIFGGILVMAALFLISHPHVISRWGPRSRKAVSEAERHSRRVSEEQKKS